MLLGLKERKSDLFAILCRAFALQYTACKHYPGELELTEGPLI